MPKTSNILSPYRQSLDPEVWDGQDLREEVRQEILSGIDEALLAYTEEPSVYVRSVYIIGSITGHRYERSSDVDVNVLLDAEGLASELGTDPEETRLALRKTLTSLNGQYLAGTHPINYYVIFEDIPPVADGIYDVLSGEWVKLPGEQDPFDPYQRYSAAIDRAEKLAERIDARWGSIVRMYGMLSRYPESAPRIRRRILRSLKNLDKIYEEVHSSRQAVFERARERGEDPPQDAPENIIYKYLELSGQLSLLMKAREILSRYRDSGELLVSEVPLD